MDADSSALIERLKDLTRPGRRGAGQRGSLRQDALTAEVKPAEDVRAWSDTVDGLTKKPREPQRMLSQSPLVFHLVGADFREIHAAPHVFDGLFPGKAKKRHNTHPNINADIPKQLPASLADPISVSGSDTVDDHLVFMLDVKDASGATVVLPVQLDAQHGFATVHIVTSAYSKEKKRSKQQVV